MLAALAALVVVTYAPVARFPLVNWDDTVYVSQNPHVLGGLSWQALRWAAMSRVAGNWHPLTMISLMLDVSLFGADPSAHHVVNAALHLGATLLLFVALRAMTGASGRSAFVAAIFAVHPLHVESVAWVAERKDVLSTFFVMATLCAYAWYVRARSWRRYAAVLALYVLALVSKPMVVTLPAILLLLDGWPLQRARWTWADWRAWLTLALEKTPMLAGALVVGIVTIGAQGGAIAGVEVLPLGARVANAVMGYVRYVGLTFWPVSLSAFYPLQTYSLAPVALAAAGLIGVTVGAFVTARKWPFILTGWLWFVVTLLPVCGLFQTGEQAIADRYMYFPLVGLSIAIAWSAEAFARAQRMNPSVIRSVAAAVVIVSTLVASQQVRVWADSETLWRHAIAVTPVNYRAYDKLGDALRDAGRLDDAAASYERAIALSPPNSPRTQATMRNSLGIIAANQGRQADALVQFSEAVRLNPDFSEAQGNLGAALATAGRLDEAAQHYEQAVRLTPDSAEAHLGLAGVTLSQGRAQEALSLYKETIALEPGMAEAYAGVAGAAAALGRRDEVYPALTEAIRLKPGLASAHVRLAQQLAADGRLAEAAAELRTAISITPNQAWQQALEDLLARIK